MNKRTFKYEIGNKVEVSGKGEGKIIDRCPNDLYLPYLVEFDKWNRGHNGDTPPHGCSEKKALGKANHCWWVDEASIKVISKSTTKTKYTTKYKPGDEVVVRSGLRGLYTMEDGTNEMWVTDQMKTKAGKVVKIKSVTKTGKYMIEGSIFPWVDGMFEKKVEKKTEKVKSKKTESREPKVGDRIRMIEDHCNAKKGMTGVIMEEIRHHRYAVRFDKYFGGHACDGQCEYGYGHYVGIDHFEIIGTEKEWTLTITGCGDTTTAVYTDTDGKAVEKTVSRYHGDEFDVRKAVDAVVEKVLPVEKKTYTVAGVTFERGGEVYNYLVNDVKLTRNTVVVVPVGKGNTPTHAVVETVGTYTEDTSPYPISKMKTVEKIEDWDGWKLVCVESNHTFWTEGKIYRVIDGKFCDDEGDARTIEFQYRHHYDKKTKEFNLNGSRFKRVIED